ncbi:MAG: branched-chain amino acid aminotransferase [Lentisphaeraceae bacterium]|nr:branched-chain amino acid aminotransferase [Lentisphaeraceae bacterium]
MSIDWKNLGFEYMDTNCHVKYTWKNGSWNNGEAVADPHINLHIGATSLHYGQACFEGLKAFRGVDGKIRIFRADENSKRMNSSARRTQMPEVPEETFIEAVKTAVEKNIEFVPPYESGGALYIRPLLIGSGPRIGIQPADEYSFIVLVIPVGNYYKGGLKPVPAVIVNGYDRTAAGGTGSVKVAGNYAASLEPQKIAKEKGFPINLYLDAKEHKYIDEFGTSNFLALSGNKYITPKSDSILPSITNKSLMTIAKDMGMTVERRPVEISEITNFDSIGACGTAVVITPVSEIHHGDKVYKVGDGTVHPQLHKLYDRIIAIQKGKAEDKFNWCITLND